MMHANSDTMGMTQWVAPFHDWLRAKIEPLQGIAALTSVDLTDAMITQIQGIRTSLVPPPLHMQTLIKNILLQQPFQMQAPAPTPAPTRQAVTPAEQWGADLQSLLRICNSSTTWQIPYIWRTMALLEKDSARAAMEAACRHTE